MLYVITGLHATTDGPQGGVFIYERLNVLHNHKIPFEVWIIESQYSNIIKYIYQRLKSKPLNNGVLPWKLEEKQHIIPVKVTTLKLLCRYLFPKHYYNSIAKHFEKKLTLDETSILHTHWVYPHGYIASILAKKHHIPCVVTAHGSDIHTAPGNNKTVKRYTLKTLNAADKVIFVSHALLDSAISLGYSRENAVVIPNGIDSQYFSQMTKEEALIKTGWKQTHKYVVGFVGNLIPVKRADKFVEIFSQIQQRVNDVEFIVIGEGYLKESIRAECQKHGLQVTFTGKIPHDDVGCWMNLFDVMILPSRNEGWPCVVLEAYACGTPVVGSTNGGIAEALGGLCPAVPDGEGFEKRFAEAVCDVLTGKVAVDKEKLVSWALEHTWEKCVEKEIEVYEQLMNKGEGEKLL